MTQSALDGTTPRILLPILGGGLYYLIARYAFSYPDALTYGVMIPLISGGLIISKYIFHRFQGIMPRILLPILAGVLYYLVAHYGFSYSRAACYGMLIAVWAGGFFTLQYFLRPSAGQ